MSVLQAVMLVDALHVATKYESHNSQELVTSYLSQPASSQQILDCKVEILDWLTKETTLAYWWNVVYCTSTFLPNAGDYG